MKRTPITLTLALAVPAVIALGAPQADSERKGWIEAPKVIMYLEKNLFVASGGVVATTTEGKLWADKMEGAFEAANGDMRVRTIDATGNVRADLDWVGSDKKRRRIKAQAERASYDAAARTVVLAGRVSGKAVEVEKDRTIDLGGDRVTLYLRESRCEVQGAPVKIIFTEPAPETETAPK